MRKLILTVSFLLAAAPFTFGQSKTLLLQKPTLSQKQIVFSFGGDLWIVPREGGVASRLITGTGIETDPVFSPDGTMVAFTGQYDGNTDVYVVPASGGVPRRLTYHPDPDFVVGWTPDGKQILFRSSRSSTNTVPRLFTIPVDGVFPTALPLPMGVDASYSPDGNRLTYVPTIQFQAAWKRYRGGQTTPIWIANLADSSTDKIHTKQLKNRLGAVFVYSVETGKSSQVTDGFSDARFATFDKNGKYLARQSDEEKVQEPKKDDKPGQSGQPAQGQAAAAQPAAAQASGGTPPAQVEKKEVTVAIDLENIGQRILALPIPPKNYTELPQAVMKKIGGTNA